MVPLTINIQGESVIGRVAERAVLTLTVSSTGKSQTTVSEDVTSTCNNLRSIFQDLAPKNADGLAPADAPVTQFSMSSFLTSSHLPRDKDGKELEREYDASTRFTIIFRDFGKLGQITSMLFRMPHVEIENTDWRLTPATIEGLGSESRKAAMEDAIRKAKDYGDVLGRNPVAVEVRDSGYQSYGRTKQTARRRAIDVAKGQVDGESLLSLVIPILILLT